MKYMVGEQLMTMTKDSVKTGALQGGGEEKHGKGGVWSVGLWDKWHQEKGYHI